MNQPCVHLMGCTSSVHKICGYYTKGVYVQLIRSTTRRYFQGWQHGPPRICMYPKNRPTKNARIHGNL